MKTLELCSGSGSFSKVARRMGYETVTVDTQRKFKPDICCDIRYLDPTKFVNQIDILWMSPPCTEFSLSKSTQDRNFDKGLELVNRCIELMDIIKPKWFVFENPVGFLNKLKVLNGFPQHKISYCKYGFDYRKNTHIWTNIPFEPLFCHHDCQSTLSHEGMRNYHKVIISGKNQTLKPGQTRANSNYATVPPRLIETLIENSQENLELVVH